MARPRGERATLKRIESLGTKLRTHDLLIEVTYTLASGPRDNIIVMKGLLFCGLEKFTIVEIEMKLLSEYVDSRSLPMLK